MSKTIERVGHSQQTGLIERNEVYTRFTRAPFWGLERGGNIVFN